MPQDVVAAPPPRSNFPRANVSTRLLWCIRDQPHCPVCMEDLDSFKRDPESLRNGGHDTYTAPQRQGVNYFYRVYVNPCGHWWCRECHDSCVTGRHFGGTQSVIDAMRLEKCSICRGGTGYFANITDDQRAAAIAEVTVESRDVSIFDVTHTPATMQPRLVPFAAAAGVVIASSRSSDNAIQRLQNGVSAGLIEQANLDAQAHRVKPLYKLPICVISCMGVSPALTPLRGVGTASYHPLGGYVNCVDGGRNPHQVIHNQSRAITKYVLEVMVALANANTPRLLVDVGGRPDKIQTFMAGGTAAMGLSVVHMCPMIEQEDFDREAQIKPFIDAGVACRCKIGPVGPGMLSSHEACQVCGINPNVPWVKRVFFLSHVYALSQEQLCALAQVGDVLWATHSFRGFDGKFAFPRGGATDIVEATWERLNGCVTMRIENGYTYTHSDHNWIHRARAWDLGASGCFKASRVLTTCDYSLQSDPTTQTSMGTTLWHLCKCPRSEVVEVVPSFMRVTAERVVEWCGTKYIFIKDGKQLQIIASGVFNDAITVSWEAFNMVARVHAAQSPNISSVYARSRSLVMPDIGAEQQNLVLCAAAAFMRPCLVAYTSSMVADRVDAAVIDRDLRGIRTHPNFFAAACGVLGGFALTGTSVGGVAGGACALWTSGQLRDIGIEGIPSYLQRNNVTPSTALIAGGFLALGTQHAFVGGLRSVAGRGAALGDVGSVVPRWYAKVVAALLGTRPLAHTDDAGIHELFGEPAVGASFPRVAVQHSWNLAETWGDRFASMSPKMPSIRLPMPSDFDALVARCRMPSPNDFDGAVAAMGFARPTGRPPDATAFQTNIDQPALGPAISDISSRRLAAIATSIVLSGILIITFRRMARHRRFAGAAGAWRRLFGAYVPWSVVSNPANLRGFLPGDAVRRAAFVALRVSFEYWIPAQAQIITCMYAAMDPYEARWLCWVLGRVSLEEIAKQAMQIAWNGAVMRYGFVACNMHLVFALVEALNKYVVYRDTVPTAIIMGGSFMSTALHYSISGLSYTQREMLHTAYNLFAAGVAPCHGLIAARMEVGKRVHDIGDGIYDRLKWGNIVGGQGFLNDIPWIAPEMREDAKVTMPSEYRWRAPKPGGMMLIGPGLSPGIRKIPTSVSTTLANEVRSIRARVTICTPTLDMPYFSNVFKPFWNEYTRSIFIDTHIIAMPRLEWLANFPPGRRRMLTEAFEDNRGDPFLAVAHNVGGKKHNPNKRKLFLKTEQTEYNKDGRAIQSGKDTTLVKAGPWCMSLCREMGKLGDGSRTHQGIHIIWGIGRDKTKCFRLFFQLAAQGSMVVMDTGDDIAVFDGERLYSLDAKRWDAHTLADMLSLGNKLWLKLGCPIIAYNNLEAGLERSGRSTLGVEYSRDGGTASGEPDTLPKNTVLNTAIGLAALVDYRNKHPFGTAGDFMETLDGVAFKLGVVYTAVERGGLIAGSGDRIHSIEFCSSYAIMCVDGEYGATPKLGKVMARFPLSKVGQPPAVALRSKAMSLLADARHSTVLTRYALLAIDCIGTGRYVRDDDWRHKQAMTTYDVDVDLEAENEMYIIRYGFNTMEILEAVDTLWYGFRDGKMFSDCPIIAHLIFVDN